MRQQVNDGKRLISIIAAATAGYGHLMRAINRMKPDEAQRMFNGLVPQAKDSKGEWVINNLSELLNGALDNIKLGLMGELGISPANIGVVLGAIMQGMSLYDALLLVKDPLVQFATRPGTGIARPEMSLLNRLSDPELLKEAPRSEQSGAIERALVLNEFLRGPTRCFACRPSTWPVTTARCSNGWTIWLS